MNDMSLLTNIEVANLARHFSQRLEDGGIAKALLNQTALRLTPIPEAIDEREKIIKLQAETIAVKDEALGVYEKVRLINEEEIQVMQTTIIDLNETIQNLI